MVLTTAEYVLALLYFWYFRFIVRLKAFIILYQEV